MKLELTTTKEIDAQYIEVVAYVRYWDDGKINGVTAKENGEDTPMKKGSAWNPIIKLSDGVIQNWPSGVEAKIHYKVCDAGNYYLLDGDFRKVALRENNYVPDCLCPQGGGYGDYIIMNIASGGEISGWSPSLDSDDWELT